MRLPSVFLFYRRYDGDKWKDERDCFDAAPSEAEEK